MGVTAKGKYEVRKEIKVLPRYIAGKPISEVKKELGLNKVVKLASNENPLGCSELVKQAILEAMNDVNIYPDAAAYELKETIASKFKVDSEMIFCGAGSDSLINVICTTILNKDDESIMGELTFPRYDSNTLLMGAKSVKVPMKENYLDLEGMVEAINEKTKIIWFCNPNNPTGSMFTAKEFEAVISKIPKNVIIVMDEAYSEFVTSREYPNSLELLEKYSNIVILKTFSKAYGLASLRIGYGIARKELVEYFNRVINTFDSNLFAQKAAIVALNDEKFIDDVREFNEEEREYLSIQFERIGLNYVQSQANFIMVNVNGDDKFIYEYLLKQGYIIRPGYLLGIPGWVRVSIGTKEQNREFCELLWEAIEERDSL